MIIICRLWICLIIIKEDAEAGTRRDPTYVLGCCWHCVASYYVTFQVLDSNPRKLVSSLSMQILYAIYLICFIDLIQFHLSYILCVVKLNIVLLLECILDVQLSNLVDWSLWKAFSSCSRKGFTLIVCLCIRHFDRNYYSRFEQMVWLYMLIRQKY